MAIIIEPWSLSADAALIVLSGLLVEVVNSFICTRVILAEGWT
jgi:hypothetical protein